MKFIDSFLNSITMYRLMLYYLICLVVTTTILSFFQVLPYNPLSIILSSLFLMTVCWLTNTCFAKIFKVITNLESVYISALILALVISPAQTLSEYYILGLIAVLAMASKYLFAIHKKHLFNPVALALALTVYFDQATTWWVGGPAMLPFVLIGGFLVVRKIKQTPLVVSFLISTIITILGISILKGSDLVVPLKTSLLYSPLFFFCLVMLIEPLTTPPTNRLQIYYGALVGLIFSSQFNIGSFYTTPEISLLIGNVYSFLVSPKQKLSLMLKQKNQLAPDIYELIFQPDQKMAFQAGQYLEWTQALKNPDSRGNRRFFTIASSPTEDTIRLGIKIYNPSSSFKQGLLNMPENSQIMAGQLAGEFTLPPDPKQPLIFIAGGIGVTPFRSHLKYLLDTHQPRPITLIYANKLASEIVYKDLFDQANTQLGIKTIYLLTDTTKVPPNWPGKVGFVTPELIKEIPNYQSAMYYISGPHAMVTNYQDVLTQMGIPSTHLKIDFFPGYI